MAEADLMEVCRVTEMSIKHGVYQVVVILKTEASQMHFIHADRLLVGTNQGDIDIINRELSVDVRVDLGDSVSVFLAGLPQHFQWDKISVQT